MQSELPNRVEQGVMGFDYKSGLFAVFALVGIPLALYYRLSSNPSTGSFEYQPQNLLEIGGKVITILGVFCLVGFIFWGIERIWPDEEDQQVPKEESYLNGLYMILNQCVMARVVATVLAAVATAIVFCHIPRLTPTWITFLPVWAQAIGIAVLKDFLGYWNHRLFHTVPWLWRFHAVHHSSEQLYWFSATREHPFEQIVGKMVTVLPLYLMGFPLTVLGPFTGIWVIYLMFLHSNTRCSFGPIVRYLVVSPTFHRWHHSNDEHILDKNFATLFPVWDFIFRTAYLPKAHHSTTYGLYKETMGKDFWSQFIYPFTIRRKENSAARSSTEESAEQNSVHPDPVPVERHLLKGVEGRVL